MKKNTPAVKFGLRAIRTFEFAIINENYDKTLNEKEMSIEASLSVGEIESDGRRNIVCMIEYMYLQKKAPFLKLKVGCMYNLSEETWKNVYDSEKKAFVLPQAFATHLLVLTLGTARGILHEKTLDTEFNHMPIPTTDVSTVFTGDVELDITGKGNIQ